MLEKKENKRSPHGYIICYKLYITQLKSGNLPSQSPRSLCTAAPSPREIKNRRERERESLA